jgi:DNA-binding MarR family transcriptional regulator
MKGLSLSEPAPPDDLAPVINAAGRSLIAAMMAGVARRGFEGMTPAFASLMPLLDATGARPTELARRAGITKQAISQLVRELERRGYVEQVADPTDTRAKIVRLTERGVALRAACFDVRQELDALGARALGPERLARLREDLRLVSDALGRAARD